MQKIKVIARDEDLVPAYASEEAAGADLRAAIEEPLILEAGESLLVPTGLTLEIPKGFEAQVRPRSGLALKHGVTVLNAPGTIDSDYRGEVGVILINHGKRAFAIEPKMRIAQIVFAPICTARFELVPELAVSARGSGGFGHTGVV